jgi:hypothetical protein
MRGRGKYKTLTLQEKMEVLNKLYNGVVKKHGVIRSTLYDIKKS